MRLITRATLLSQVLLGTLVLAAPFFGVNEDAADIQNLSVDTNDHISFNYGWFQGNNDDDGNDVFDNDWFLPDEEVPPPPPKSSSLRLPLLPNKGAQLGVGRKFARLGQ
ncbi:hypothetical protein H4219_004096 [Mycoemilia scoparia]|uniref:Secreted protein n=1 Tax=Mycoemilia scoparia TaxID=417184 RepID=A0A9W8A0W7_9FUNG|nr:hypothetical protein H4219_004096 [Mycoemilia scoparia]